MEHFIQKRYIYSTFRRASVFLFMASVICCLPIFSNSLIADSARTSIITPESIRTHHQALVNISTKKSGFDSGIRLNKAGKEAAEYLLTHYQKAGLENVAYEEFYPNRWWPEKYGVTVLGDTNKPDLRLNAFPLWHCQGAKDLELEVVYAGFGTSGEFRGLDIKGKAVLIDMKRLLHFIQSYGITKALEKAKKGGAKAIIIAETRIDGPTGNRVGNVGEIKNQKAEKPDLFPIPVFSIGKSDGIKLKNRMKLGPVNVKINLEYSLVPSIANNIVGELSGNGKIDETIIIGGHYDSWFDGAIDNLGSQASILEIARYFSMIPQSQRDRNIIFVSMFGHEIGNETMGQAAFVERHANLQGKVTCFFNIDGSGSWGWEEKDDSNEIYPTGQDDKAGILASSRTLSALTHKSIYKHAKGPWVNYPSNVFVADIRGSIAEAGYPVLLIINKHIYYHSTFDTIDRISPDQVYRRTLINIDIVNSLLNSEEGHIISVDTNPHRKLKEGEIVKTDLTLDQFPQNPNSWLAGPPSDLSLHLIPEQPKVFSPIIGWVGYWNSDAVIKPDGVSWEFGGLLGLTGPKKNFYAGTMYFFPGNKTISLTITDSKGLSTTVSREVTVRAAELAFIYWLVPLVLILLTGLVVWKVRKRNS